MSGTRPRTLTRLASLTRRGDLRALSPVARRVVLVLAILTPLVVAGVSVSSMQVPAASTAAVPAVLPAAIVNDDQFVKVDQNGTEQTVLAGKLLVSQLTSPNTTTGFDWTVTDADTASSGLASGQFSAVVTIPSNFSASYVSLSSPNPVQAQLQVQTNGAESYVGQLLASALSTNLQAALSSTVTKQFTETTLGGFTTLQQNLVPAAAGADKLAGLQTQLAGGAGELATNLHKAASGAGDLQNGLTQYAGVMQTIATATADLPTYAGYLADGTSLVDQGVIALRDSVGKKAADVGTLAADQTTNATQLQQIIDTVTDPALKAQLQTVQQSMTSVADRTAVTSVGLDFDTLGGSVLSLGSGVVDQGARLFADDLPYLSTGLQGAATAASAIATQTGGLTTGLSLLADGSDKLTQGASGIAGGLTDLGTGLDSATANIPTYTTDQASAIATVVAQPVVTTSTDVGAVPGPGAAIAAVAVPVALWIGALVLYLVLMPFTRSALLSTASTLRVVVSALRWPLLLGVVQAVLVAAILFALGAHPAHLAGSVVFVFVMTVSFVMLHQGLVALLGQGGRILSIALVVVQVVAAAVVIPSGLSSPAYTALASVLPLSHAISGMQLLVTGGSLLGVLGDAVALAVFALLGFVLAIVAAARARSRDLVAVTEVSEETAAASGAGSDAVPPRAGSVSPASA